MKKLISILVVMCGLFCASQTMADTTTSRFGLTLPTIGSSNWGPKLNNNFSLLDALAGQSISNTFTSSNTFTAYNNFTGGVTMASTTITNLTVTNSTGNTSNINVVTATTSVINNETIKNSFTSNNGSTMTVNGLFSAPASSTFSALSSSITMGSPANGQFQINTSTFQVIGSSISVGTANSTTTIYGQLNFGATVPSSGTYAVGRGPGQPSAWVYDGRTMQIQTSSTTTNFTTTNTNFFAVKTTTTITVPAARSNSILKIETSGSFSTSTGAECDLTILRNGINIMPGGNIFQTVILGGNQFVPQNAVWYDTPGSGTWNYSVGIRSSAGTANCGWPSAGQTGIIVVTEIGNGN